MFYTYSISQFRPAVQWLLYWTVLGGGDCPAVGYSVWIPEKSLASSSWRRKLDDRTGSVKGENAREKVNPRQNGIVIRFVRIWLLHWIAWSQKRDELVILIQSMFSWIALLFSLLFESILFIYLSTVHLPLIIM